jgi:type II secretory ATPase GspE/PulE/Tfp pilus assembly ATPase PilB-like protein
MGLRADEHAAAVRGEPSLGEHDQMTHAYLPESQPMDSDGNMIKVIAYADELPDYIKVLTLPGGVLAVRPDDQRFVALLDHGNQQVSLVSSPDRHATAARRSLLTRAQQNGYTLINSYEAQTEVLIGLYARRDPRVDVQGGDTANTRFLRELLQAAILKKASDVHIRVRPEAGYIYLRINNDLRRYSSITYEEAQALSNAMYNTMSSDRGKSGSFNANECQDAQIIRDDIEVNGRANRVSLRYSGMPLHPSGWKIVLRILPLGQEFRQNSLQDWGFTDAQVAALSQAIASPVGAILVCGPTGAGKSTSLTAALRMYNEVHSGERQIYTIEDPVEAVLGFADQLPVTRNGPDDKKAFARALRQVLRSDPDCIMIQEMRDEETVELFAHATETGHKTLGTVHATTVFQAIERLVDLKMRRQLLTSPDFINLVFTQRLISVVCPACARAFSDVAPRLSPDFLDRLSQVVKPEEHQGLRFRGPGCNACNGTGKAGRTAIVEMLVPHPELMLALSREDLIYAERLWRAGGAQDRHGVNGISYRDHAIDKIRAGIACPVSVEKEIGWLTEGTTRQEAANWINRHSKPGSMP